MLQGQMIDNRHTDLTRNILPPSIQWHEIVIPPLLQSSFSELLSIMNSLIAQRNTRSQDGLQKLSPWRERRKPCSSCITELRIWKQQNWNNRISQNNRNTWHQFRKLFSSKRFRLLILQAMLAPALPSPVAFTAHLQGGGHVIFAV